MDLSKKHILKLYVFFVLIGCQSALCNSQNTSVSPKAEFQSSLNQPQQVIKLGEGHYLLDFGKAYFGTVILKPKRNQSDSLIIHVGEKLSGNKGLDRNPGATLRYQKVKLNQLKANQEETISLFAYKRNSKPPAILLPDSFGVVMPFRYCELENLQIPIDDIVVYQKAYYYKFNDEAGTFTSSDTILNKVWDLCKHTVKATTFTGYYVDGDRERIPYEADAYINQLSHYSVDTVYAIARRTNEYFIDHPTWPTEWLLHTVMLFYQDYMYSGDITLLRKYYEVLKIRTLQDLAREDGLISSKSEKLTAELKNKLGFSNPNTQIKDIVDWPSARGNSGKKWLPELGERDGYEMVDVNTVVNAFYYHNMVLMSHIAKALNKSDDAIMFMKKSAVVKEAINAKMFDVSRGVYIDGEGSDHASLHANMLPLAFGLVPSEYEKTVVAFIKSRGMACSVYGAQYLLEGLFNANEPYYALDLITDTSHDRTWWHMIELGSTMTMEAWDEKYKSNLDWNHAWGTAPLNVVARHLWGITPKTPGFASALIKPQMGYLTSSEIKVPTLKGCIMGVYKLEKNNVALYTIELPSSVNAEFVLPVNCTKVIKAKCYNAESSTIQLKAGVNRIKLKLDGK